MLIMFYVVYCITAYIFNFLLIMAYYAFNFVIVHLLVCANCIFNFCIVQSTLLLSLFGVCHLSFTRTVTEWYIQPDGPIQLLV